MIETKICEECGRKYIPNRRTINRQKYCNERCSDKFWNLSIKERRKLKDLIKENKTLKKEIRDLRKLTRKST